MNRTRLSVFVLAVLFTPILAGADDPPKVQFQIIPLTTLSKESGQYNWSDKTFLEALDKTGADGWEFLTNSDHAVLFRKSAQKWEYKSVKVKNSPFPTLPSAGGADLDAYALILEWMAADGWTPCATNGLGEYTLFRREKRTDDTKPAKAEYQTLIWNKVIKDTGGAAGRWVQKVFLETLNKQGAEGCQL